LLAFGFLAAARAQDPGVDLFEKKIRPALVERCEQCHSAKISSPMGGLRLDTAAGLLAGGASGPAVVPGDPGASRLLEAIRFTDPSLKMPPQGKLPDATIAAFEEWIRLGAPDPRTPEPAEAESPASKAMSLEEGRRWWAFQSAVEREAPRVQNAAWVRRKVDAFVLSRLEQRGVSPSPEADRRTLIRRATVDLTGLQPTYEETERFVRDTSEDAYIRLIERLLASPHYGEQWGRHWLDVARWAEDNPTSEATNRPYTHAWRYRDWVIQALNSDTPYDVFVKKQLSADLLPGFEREDLPALGYLGTAPVYHKDARLSRDVIETIASDDWDERVDAVSRGLLGLSVACARCHDHKFDPISQKDYQALAGVFASSMMVVRPLGDVSPETEEKFVWMHDRIERASYMAKMLKGEPGTDVEGSRRRVAALQEEVARLETEVPKLDEPFVHAVYDAGVWVDGSDPALTQMDFRPGEARDLPVFLGGNVARTGEIVPRRFLTVFSETAPEPFAVGSGRLELAEAIFDEAAPLAARVIVNRVWGWHFGRPLVETASDFGAMGEKPSHPELLDDLAARFIANGWSLKWLHREILFSSVYRQASKPRAEAAKVDPANALVWRMNPRRLDVEAFRDALLQTAGSLDLTAGGPSQPADDPLSVRRTVYASVSRSKPDALLAMYDFPDMTQHAPSRETTTSPLQQLFVMNSQFIEARAAELAARVPADLAAADQVRALYRLALLRDPSPKEIDLGVTYLEQGRERYAQALLSLNELQFLE
jgi:hypothetical protein